MENDSATGRIFNERLAEKIPPAIPETSAPIPGHLIIDTDSAVRNGDPPTTPARQQKNSLTRSASLCELCLVSFCSILGSDHLLTMGLSSLDSICRDRAGRRGSYCNRSFTPFPTRGRICRPAQPLSLRVVQTSTRSLNHQRSIRR
jgi:hypothetical protein